MVRDDEQIDCPDTVGRTHQVEFLIPGEIAKMHGAEFSERHNTADGTGVLARVVVLWLMRGAVRVRSSRASQRLLDRLAIRGDNPPIKSGDRNGVARFCDRVLRGGAEFWINIGEEFVRRRL